MELCPVKPATRRQCQSQPEGGRGQTPARAGESWETNASEIGLESAWAERFVGGFGDYPSMNAPLLKKEYRNSSRGEK